MYLCIENKMDMIERFKNSQDFIDISYMIDHVNDIEFRISLLEGLGYRVGTSIVKTDLGVKHIVLGKKNEIRMQVTPKCKNLNIARCVIIEPKNIFFQNE